MREKGEKWSSSEINGPSCRHLLNLFIVATNIIAHRYVVVVSQHGVHSMICGGKGKRTRRKGTVRQVCASREHTENTRRPTLVEVREASKEEARVTGERTQEEPKK